MGGPLLGTAHGSAQRRKFPSCSAFSNRFTLGRQVGALQWDVRCEAEEEERDGTLEASLGAPLTVTCTALSGGPVSTHLHHLCLLSR